MPRKNPKLVKWLIDLLERKEFDDIGFEWEDRSDGLFWIPHPRQNCKKWRPRHSALIVAYNQMQGHYKRDEKPDLPKWKHNLGAALQKMTNNMNRIDNSTPLPRKLYQIREMAGREMAVMTDSSSSSTTSSNPSSPESDSMIDECLEILNLNDGETDIPPLFGDLEALEKLLVLPDITNQDYNYPET